MIVPKERNPPYSQIFAMRFLQYPYRVYFILPMTRDTIYPYDFDVVFGRYSLEIVKVLRLLY